MAAVPKTVTSAVKFCGELFDTNNIIFAVVEGRIRLRPRTKVNIRDFVHWVRDMIGVSEYLTATPFTTRERYDIIDI